MQSKTTYFEKLAAAFVRGTLGTDAVRGPNQRLFNTPLSSLSATNLKRLIEIGIEQGLRLHRFKRTMGLARVKAVIGALRSFNPASLLDIGSGRGAFLWPLLDAFADLSVTAVDRLEHRVRDIQAVHRGGIGQLSGIHADAIALPFDDAAFDVVTALEVLEHIPDTQTATNETCRVASRAIVVSVPSKPDDNPEHIHFFSDKDIRQLFKAAGIERISIRHVLNHLIAVAVKPPP